MSIKVRIWTDTTSARQEPDPRCCLCDSRFSIGATLVELTDGDRPGPPGVDYFGFVCPKCLGLNAEQRAWRMRSHAAGLRGRADQLDRCHDALTQGFLKLPTPAEVEAEAVRAREASEASPQEVVAVVSEGGAAPS